MTGFTVGEKVITPNGAVGAVTRVESAPDGATRRVVVRGVSWPAENVRHLVDDWEARDR